MRRSGKRHKKTQKVSETETGRKDTLIKDTERDMLVIQEAQPDSQLFS